jgi:hypothetical protein
MHAESRLHSCWREDETVAATKITLAVEGFQNTGRGGSREKWAALIAFVLVTVSAVALLLPR